MADFAQQRPQGLFAALLLGGLDRGGNDAAHVAVGAMSASIQRSNHCAPVRIGNTDLEPVGICGGQHRPLRGRDALGDIGEGRKSPSVKPTILPEAQLAGTFCAQTT